MWVLSTDRAELHYFTHPEVIPGGYAILSHVWGAKEQTFQETQRLGSTCVWFWRNPREYSSEKVRQSCVVAERDGYRWIWNDTCCIDKSSSAELSEAINSMYNYYTLADVCYAYLADVPGTPTDNGADMDFRRSSWHTRGWTLQELIAPPFLIFLSAEWTRLGTRVDQAPLLTRVTHIPVEVLLRKKEVHAFSVAQRMSWAFGRKTTRIEDRAYSLLGIFSVNMSPIYGEGDRAFQRLQEEIMRQSIDPSLFAWGAPVDPNYPVPESWKSVDNHSAKHVHPQSYLFTPTPDSFSPAFCGAIISHEEASTYTPIEEVCSPLVRSIFSHHHSKSCRSPRFLGSVLSNTTPFHSQHSQHTYLYNHSIWLSSSHRMLQNW